MNRPLHIAIFVGSFPELSETFIVRQMTGLLDVGHKLDIYADARANASAVHPEVTAHRLLERTTFMDLPPEIAPWELPAWPLTARTWPPGSTRPVYNSVRLARALPRLLRCLVTAPHLTRQALSPAEYGFQATSLSALYRLARLASCKKQYDVLHAHFGPVGNSFRCARALWRAPLVVSFHGYDFSTLPRKQGPALYEKLFATADAITVNSQCTWAQVEKLGCPPGKLHKVLMGLRLEDYPFVERTIRPGEPVRILTVARLVEKKGLEYSIRAVAQAHARHPALRYDIVGEGPLRPRLEALIRELGMNDRIFLHGARPANEVGEYLAGAHLFVLASVTAADGDQEGQGLVLQEAQASGLPVLATDHAAFAEGIAPGKSGFLVPERGVEALAARLGELISHPETWPAMGRAGRDFVAAHFELAQLTRQLAAVYEHAMEAYRGTA